MPYVNEAYSSPVFVIEVGSTVGGARYPFTVTSVTSKSQYGWRSGPLFEADRRALESSLYGRNWATQLSSINALERLTSAASQSPRFTRSWPADDVHERHYRQYQSPYREFDIVTEYLSYSTGEWVKGPPYNAIAQCLATDGLDFPPITREAFEAKATSIMRSIRPTKSEFELARFVGEARELPMMGRLLKLDPRNLADYGSGFLGYNFGLAPTVSDVKRLAEVIAKSEAVVTRFAEHASRLISRKSKLRIATESVSGSGKSMYAGYRASVNGPTRLFTHGGMAGTSPVGTVEWSLSGHRTMRTFALFEYFVADPYGAASRISSYVQRAEKLLGVKLDAATAWELTPWTWMTDWFIDIGGLLAYQQDVADNGLVARRSGFLIEDEYNALSTIRPYATSNRRTVFPDIAIPAQHKVQQRFKGSPYSMSPNWDLTGFQWAIVGALGLTRAPKIPFSRT